MKLSTLFLIVALMLDSAAIAEWPLHQNFPSANGGRTSTFFDSHGRYIDRPTIYPPAIELHQANGTSRTLPYPTQRLPDSHGNAQAHRYQGHQQTNFADRKAEHGGGP